MEAVGVVKLPLTWRNYYLRVPARELALPFHEQGMAASSSPLPATYQTDLPPDILEQLPDPIGQFPMGPFMERYALALRRGLDPEADPTANPGLDWTPMPAEIKPVLARTNRAKHTNFRQVVPAGVDTPVLPSDDGRSYLLVINSDPANNALIAFDKSSNGGIELTFAGGFLELPDGTASGMRAQGVGGTAELTIVEGRQYPDGHCRLPCD